MLLCVYMHALMLLAYVLKGFSFRDYVDCINIAHDKPSHYMLSFSVYFSSYVIKGATISLGLIKCVRIASY